MTTSRRQVAPLRFTCGAVMLAALGACAAGSPARAPEPASPTQTSLKHFLDTLVDSPDFRSAQWGILVVDPGRGETLYARNADKLFMPASNMKLLTGSTALAQLGADYRWTTTLLARGPVRNSVLDGDLVVRGNGDPSVSTHMQKGDALAPLRALADSLRAHGITRIRGRLTAAPSPFVDAPLGQGWAWDDLDEAYSAGVDALYFNEGFTEVVIRGGKSAGDPVRVSTRPAASFPTVIVKARTIGRGVAGDASARPSINLSQDSSRTGVLVEGTVVAGDSVVQQIAFRDQAAAYLLALREAFAARGIVVEDARTDTTARVDSLVSMRSPTLREVLPFFEKPSQNQIGEILLKTLALEKTGVGRADSGSKVVTRQALAWGAEADGLAVRDGSGLSRHDYLTPRTIIHVLDAIRKHPDFKAFYDGLPIAGVDGTIGSRMRNTPAAGNLHAKTGTLDKARSLSGYVTTADGRMLLFSALCNNYVVPTSRVDRVSNALGAYLAAMRLDP